MQKSEQLKSSINDLLGRLREPLKHPMEKVEVASELVALLCHAVHDLQVQVELLQGGDSGNITGDDSDSAGE